MRCCVVRVAPAAVRVSAIMLTTIACLTLLGSATGLQLSARRLAAPRMAAKAFSGDDASISRDADLVFAVLDKNGDGVVSREELCDHLFRAGYQDDVIDKWFDKSSLEKGGFVSQDEMRTAFLSYPAMRTAPALGMNNEGDIPEAIRMDATNFIFAVDSSRDGEIASPELESHMSKLGFSTEAIAHVFAQLDLDANGVLTRDEIAEVFLKYSALRLALRTR